MGVFLLTTLSAEDDWPQTISHFRWSEILHVGWNSSNKRFVTICSVLASRLRPLSFGFSTAHFAGMCSHGPQCQNYPNDNVHPPWFLWFLRAPLMQPQRCYSVPCCFVLVPWSEIKSHVDQVRLRGRGLIFSDPRYLLFPESGFSVTTLPSQLCVVV